MSSDLPTEWTAEPSPAPLEAEWRALEAEGFGTPFQSYDWMRLHHEMFGEGVFVAGRRAGRLRALFPLRLRMGTVGWLGDALTNYNMPLLSADLHDGLSDKDVSAMWSAVRAALGGPAASVLRRQPVRVGGKDNPFARWSSVVEPTSAYALTLGRAWPDFYEALHSPATRKTLRKKERGLAKGGAVSIHVVEDRGAVLDHARRLLEIKAEQVRAEGGRNNFANPRNREFIARFAAEHPGRARVYAMTQNGTPIALAYRIESGATPILYQTAYTAGPTARFSPGRLLLNRILEDAVTEGRRVLDLAVGDEPYKLQLCNEITPLTTSLAAHRPWGMPAVLAERAILAAKRVVKSRRKMLPPEVSGETIDKAD